MDPFEIIQPYTLYPISKHIFIVSGTPFLYLQDLNALVFGDIHLGIVSSLFNTTGTKPLSSDVQSKLDTNLKNILDQLEKTIRICKVKTIILNGDIKHNSRTIANEEIEEITLFLEYLTSIAEEVFILKGNHDEFLELIITYLEIPKITTKSFLDTPNYFIQHGHLETYPKPKATVILSHEHPARIIHGYNRARKKLAAFVTLHTKSNFVIILPAANSVSLGVPFPPKNNEAFLSPYLRKTADINTIDILPFDQDVGIFELPSS